MIYKAPKSEWTESWGYAYWRS